MRSSNHARDIQWRISRLDAKFHLRVADPFRRHRVNQAGMQFIFSRPMLGPCQIVIDRHSVLRQRRSAPRLFTGLRIIELAQVDVLATAARSVKSGSLKDEAETADRLE